MNHRGTENTERRQTKRKIETLPSAFSLLVAFLCVLCASVVNPCFPAEPARLTTDGSFKQNLQWSPDGKTLLFTRIHQGKMSLWTMPATGGEMKRLLPDHA